MALKDLLLRCAGICNPGNLGKLAGVTEKRLLEQRCNLCNPCNPENPDGADGAAQSAALLPRPEPDRLTRPLQGEVTEDTEVTPLNHKANTGNPVKKGEDTEVTAGQRRCLGPLPRSLVAPVVAAGGGLWKFAHNLSDIDPALVAELKADGWSVSGIEEICQDVADSMRRAEQAMAELEDSDRGEVE